MKISSLIEFVKSEMENLKEKLENIDTVEDPNSNVLRYSTKKKNKQIKNNRKSDDFKSTEGISIMNTSLEGVSLEKDSFEGKSMMDYSVEENYIKKDKMDNKTFKKDNKNFKLDKLKIKDKNNLKEYIIFSEILSKPKSLK